MTDPALWQGTKRTRAYRVNSSIMVAPDSMPRSTVWIGYGGSMLSREWWTCPECHSQIAPYERHAHR